MNVFFAASESDKLPHACANFEPFGFFMFLHLLLFDRGVEQRVLHFDLVN
jgi:hypothetical protein